MQRSFTDKDEKVAWVSSGRLYTEDFGKKKLILTCEHGGNDVPAEYKGYFEDATPVLNSHRGYDPGALPLAKHLQAVLGTKLHFSTTSRLLIELNRSLHHPALFSTFTKSLPAELKKALINEYYLPYRKKVEEEIRNYIKEKHTVIHVSVHSFTPVLNGVARNCSIGLLYDPQRKLEKEFCVAWRNALSSKKNSIRTRMNYPYRGNADGFTTYLRKVFEKNYLGIELEVNQGWWESDENLVYQSIAKSLKEVVKP